MTTKERERLNKGLTQSSSDSRKTQDGNGYSQKNVGSNRTIIDGTTYRGYTAAKNAREKKQ